MAWYKVADDTAKPPLLQAVKAAGKSLCLVYHNGQYYATQLYCPHAGANLSNGTCADGKLVCPYHRFTYDLVTGNGGEGQGDYINTYKVQVRNREVLVEVGTLTEKIKKLFNRSQREE
jgi:nitrite reductase/ring-hydroxylating ferredoxin subunit